MSTRPPSRPSRLLPVLLLAVVVTACADPVDEDPDRGEAAENPLGSQQPDPAHDALVAEVETLEQVLAAARDRLEAAVEADAVGAARTAGADAVELLIGTPSGGTPALFPVETTERGAASERDDQLTAVLTVAREAGGTAGGDVREAMRDLVAGDLGSWQRDPDGMIEQITATATSGGSLEATEEAVFEVPGEAARALAWALLLEDAGDLGAATAYAERGAAHLGVALSAISDLELGS